MANSFDRRSFLARGLVAAAGVAGVAGVGATAELLVPDGVAGAGTNGPGRNGISTAKPKRGGSVVIGVDAEEQGFNPATARFDAVGVMYARTVFDPLAILTANGSVAPYLAQSIIPNADYTSWVITLRPNVVFHDGSPCDGAALLMNLEAQKSSFLTGLELTPVTGFSQSGPLSVTVNLDSPWVPFPYYLAGGIGGQLAYLAAPAMLNATNGGTDNPIGTGPFKFKEWIPNQHFTAVANPHYWRPGLPYLSSITYRPFADYNAQSEALESGTVDLIVTDVPQTIVLYRGKRQWSYVDDSGAVIGEPDMNCSLLNVAKAPFDNPDVRLACAKAVSNKDYSTEVDLGVNAASNGIFVPGSPYYSANSGYPAPDPKGAAALVKKVEHQTGQPVSFTIGTIPSPNSIRSNEYIQQLYQAVGMKVNLTNIAQDQLINNALAGTFQLLSWRQFSAVNPDLNYVWWSTSTVANSGISINMTRNKDPQLEAALQAGRQATTQAARLAAYKTVSQRLNLDLPYLWQDRATWAAIADTKVQNFNNPTTPSGTKAAGFLAGSIWPTQIWMS